MADERDEAPPPEYAEGRVCHFTTLSRVDEPLAAHLSPDYVRGLVDVPDSEADLLAEWRAARARGETPPEWMTSKVGEMAGKDKAPGTGAGRWRPRFWLRATERLSRFQRAGKKLSELRSCKLIQHERSAMGREGRRFNHVEAESIRRAVQRAKRAIGTD